MWREMKRLLQDCHKWTQSWSAVLNKRPARKFLTFQTTKEPVLSSSRGLFMSLFSCLEGVQVLESLLLGFCCENLFQLNWFLLNSMNNLAPVGGLTVLASNQREVGSSSWSSVGVTSQRRRIWAQCGRNGSEIRSVCQPNSCLSGQWYKVPAGRKKKLLKLFYPFCY